MCADEADVDQQEIKGVAVISYNVLQEVPWKLEIKCKAGMYLLVNFGSSLLLWYCPLKTGGGEVTQWATSSQCHKGFLSIVHNFLKGVLLFRSKLAQPQLAQSYKI